MKAVVADLERLVLTQSIDTIEPPGEEVGAVQETENETVVGEEDDTTTDVPAPATATTTTTAPRTTSAAEMMPVI
jgi:hypothetical protein